jgi:hypothetical protein
MTSVPTKSNPQNPSPSLPVLRFVIDPNLSKDDRDKIKAGYNEAKDSLKNYKPGSADYKRMQRALTLAAMIP